MNNQEQAKRNRQPPILLPLCIGVLLTLATSLFDLDMRFGHALYNTETGHWLLDKIKAERYVFRYSPIPSFLCFGYGLVVAIGSIWVERWRRLRRVGACLALAMLLGPGLVVNGIFKEFYGRPRPKQTVEFGGEMQYRPVWIVGIPHEAKSFPCGHASIGFYFIVFYFIYRRRNRRAARGWMAFGLVFGVVIGAIRMAKGGHWFSDVVWAGVFVYYTSYLSAWVSGLLVSREETVA